MGLYGKAEDGPPLIFLRAEWTRKKCVYGMRVAKSHNARKPIRSACNGKEPVDGGATSFGLLMSKLMRQTKLVSQIRPQTVVITAFVANRSMAVSETE
jgi:hypothetical protein